MCSSIAWASRSACSRSPSRTAARSSSRPSSPRTSPPGRAGDSGCPPGHPRDEQQHGRDPTGHAQQHAQGDRAEGQGPGLAGLGLAGGEQMLLLVLHGLELGDDRVRGHLVPVEQLGPALRGLAGPDVGHQGGQDRRPLPGQRPDPGQPGGLPGVVVDQAAEVIDGRGQLPPGALVRGEVAPLPGQHVPDHPGLDEDADLGDLALDLDRVQHRPLGPPVLGQGDPEQHRGQQQGEQRDGDHHQSLGPQRQVRPRPPHPGPARPPFLPSLG
jgi:hypothetical protein